MGQGLRALAIELSKRLLGCADAARVANRLHHRQAELVRSALNAFALKRTALVKHINQAVRCGVDCSCNRVFDLALLRTINELSGIQQLVRGFFQLAHFRQIFVRVECL